MAESSLKNRTVKGVGWSFADSILGQGITFIVGLVLARLLSPEEYGLIGIVTIFTSILGGVVDSGFGTALIRKQDCTDDDYNTMFITNLTFSIVLYVGLFFSAEAIARFFERQQLVGLVRVLGFSLIIDALSIVQYTRLAKRIDFKTKTKASLISAILSGVVGIGMAFAGFGVWALVAQQLTRQTLYTICLWIFNKWIPRLHFNLRSLKYMWGFGWKLMVSGLLDSIWSQLYQTIVARFYTPSTLGQYSRANEYASIFSSNLNKVVGKVSYPVLSEIQDDKKRLIAAYRRIIKMTMFVTVICMISMGAVAEPMIYCLIGPQWHQAATFLPLICILMSMYPLNAINLNMLKVQGRSDIFLILEIVKKIIAIGPLCIGIFIGIYWMLVGSIIVGVIAFFLNTWYTGKSLGYTSWMQIKDIAPSYGIAIIIALGVFFVKYLPFNCWIILPIQIVLGIVIFFILMRIVKPSEYEEIKGIVNVYWRRIKK